MNNWRLFEHRVWWTKRSNVMRLIWEMLQGHLQGNQRHSKTALDLKQKKYVHTGTKSSNRRACVGVASRLDSGSSLRHRDRRCYWGSNLWKVQVRSVLRCLAPEQCGEKMSAMPFKRPRNTPELGSKKGEKYDASSPSSLYVPFPDTCASRLPFTQMGEWSWGAKREMLALEDRSSTAPGESNNTEWRFEAEAGNIGLAFGAVLGLSNTG